MDAPSSFAPAPPGPAGEKLNLAMLCSPDHPVPAVVLCLRQRGHTVSLRCGVDELTALDPRPDAIFIAADAPVPALLAAAAMAPAAPAWPHLVFLGIAWPEPLAWPGGIWRDFVADPPSAQQLDALLDRLACRRAQDAQASAAARQLEDLQLGLSMVQDEFLRLSSRLSHELQGTLKHVAQMSRRLQTGAALAAEPSLGRHLEMIAMAAERGQAVTRDLVALAQITVSKPWPTSVDLAALVAQCITEIGRGSDRAVWRVAQLPAVFGDPALLCVAIRHLLANAVKFSAGQSRPCIEVAAVADAGGTTLQVLDNGVGFDPARAHRLFLPLERLHPASAFEGNGMGLAMVKAVADRHGGSVAARARPAGGSVFSLWLPRPPAQAPAATQRQDNPRSASPLPGGRWVLVIDDEELVLAIISAMLRRDGHQVRIAASGEEGLALLGECGPFDVVICDWHMPGIEGPAVMKEVKRIHAGTTTILLTGRALRSEHLAADASVDALLSKPVTRGDLRRAMAPCGRGRAARGALA